MNSTVRTLSTPRAHVNGTFLAQYHSKPVVMMGTIVKAEAGSSVQLKSTDGQLINIRLKSPLTEPLTGSLEVAGVGQGKNLIIAESWVHFNETIGTGWDSTIWNEMIGILNTMEENPWRPTA